MVQQSAAKPHSAIPILKKIFECEMAGIVRYLHYSSVAHTIVIGEKITSLGGHPPAVSASVTETNVHTIDGMLRESLDFEAEALGHYQQLVKVAEEEGDIALEELAREFVRTEQEHHDEVNKMLRSPK